MEKKATTAVDSHQATENQALLVSEHPAECRYSNTREEKTQFLKTPLVPKIGTLICIPYPARQVS